MPPQDARVEEITPAHHPSVASLLFYQEAMRLWREAKTDEDRQDLMICLDIASSCALVGISQSLLDLAHTMANTTTR